MCKFEDDDYCCACGRVIEEGYLTNDDSLLMCADCYNQLSDEEVNDYLVNDVVPNQSN